MAGQDTACPHCRRETTLLLPRAEKADSGSVIFTPIPRDESKSELLPTTKFLLAIIVITIIAIPIILILKHQSYLAETDRNWYDVTNQWWNKVDHKP